MLGGGFELRVALDNLSVTDPGQRANALEVIESVSDRELVRPLLTMWEGATPSIDRRDALALLADDPDDWIRSCTALVTASQGGSMTETLTTLSLMERVLFLRKVPLFGALAPPDLEPIASIAREQAFADGDVLAEQGEHGVEMHIIVSGEVSVITGAGERTTRRSHPVLGRRRRRDVVAHERTTNRGARVRRPRPRAHDRPPPVRGDPARAAGNLASA